MENFPFFLFNVVVDILKEGLHLLIEVLIGRLEPRNLCEQFVDILVFLQRVRYELSRFGAILRLDGRIKDFFLRPGMNLQLAANPLEQLEPLFMRRFARPAIFVEETSHSRMITFQKSSIHSFRTPDESLCTPPAKMESKCHSGGPRLAGFFGGGIMPIAVQRRLPVGAEPAADGTHFRVWAARRKKVEVVLDGLRTLELGRERDGYFSGFVDGVHTGMLYQFRLDGDGPLRPDPASRFQPEGPHGPSQIVDPFSYRWTDEQWAGARIEGQVLYEMHIGSFTREGTWKSAIEQLPKLAETGITLVEVMPVADFAGTFGWGYDGVNLYAPTRLYGVPDDFRSFIDRAHSFGIGVVLDVVYNHFGPDGNYLQEFSDEYFTTRYGNEWGQAINFDGDDSGPVREFFIHNAAYWIREFHLDGLRLDATQQIFDESADHILACISREARSAAGKRPIVLIAENEPQHTRLLKPIESGGAD